MNKEQLIALLTPHKEKLSTAREWNKYARENNLPISDTLIYHFETWNNVKKSLNVDIQKGAYTLEELKEIAEKHKEFFKTAAMWLEYSRENNLPSPATFIRAFESWNEVKSFLNLNTPKRKKNLYSKAEIEVILKEHGKNFVNRKQWDEYSKDNKLPTYKTIKKHFTYDEILTIINKNKQFNFTKNELATIAWDHNCAFFTMKMKDWDEYAKENKLPSSYIFSNVFGSWRKAKGEIVLDYRDFKREP